MENSEITRENISKEIIEILNEILNPSGLCEKRNTIFDTLAQLTDESSTAYLTKTEHSLLFYLNRLFCLREQELINNACYHLENQLMAGIKFSETLDTIRSIKSLTNSDYNK